MTDILQAIKAAAAKQVLVLPHAKVEAAREQPQVTEADIVAALQYPTLAEDYPEDKRGHSALVLGWVGDRPLHLVVSPKSQGLSVITVYVPNSAKWDKMLLKRKAMSSSIRIAMPMPTSLPEGWSIKTRNYDKYTQSFVLQNNKNDTIAMLDISRNADAPDVWKMDYVNNLSKRGGWGAFLYETALKWVSTRGEYLAPDDSVSADAEQVWAKYSQRPDVTSSPHTHSSISVNPSNSQSKMPSPDFDTWSRETHPHLYNKYRISSLAPKVAPVQQSTRVGYIGNTVYFLKSKV